MMMMRFSLVFGSCFLFAFASATIANEGTIGAGTDWSTVTFDTPTPEPGTNIGGIPVISGGMPIGNGETAALVFPLDKPLETDSFRLEEGVHVWVSMATAMASDMSLMPIGVVSIITNPPLGTKDFSQTLSLQNATVEIKTSQGRVQVWIDATTNAVRAKILPANFLSHGNNESAAPTMQATVTIRSLRPRKRFKYGGRCYNATSEPDIFKTRIAGKNSISLSHRNMDTDITFLNMKAAFNTTLRQQGLSKFTDMMQKGDHWRHRQFGMVVSGCNKFVLKSSISDHISSLDAQDIKPAEPAQVTITTLSAQTESSESWEEEIAKQHRDHLLKAALHKTSHDAFWDEFWNRSHIWVSSKDKSTSTLTQRYAQTRYLQAIQAGTRWPIKFNGELFNAQVALNSSSFRAWGSSNWWQNTRLAYWNMGASGDVAQLRTIFDYYMQMLPLLNVRTKAAFNHSGVYTTETKTLFGLYDPCDYGTAAENRSSSDLNFGYEETRWLKYDFGGDAGLTELCVMLLDFYTYTLDDDAMATYLPLLTGTLDFFSKHYEDVEAHKKLTIFPTQALETYQCPVYPPTPKNCPTNDHPTVAALHVLTERALELPSHFSTRRQRDQWSALAAALPAVPMTTENGHAVVSPYETFNVASTVHLSNTETPELYSTHPFRYFTLGRSRLPGAQKRDIRPSIYCLENSTRISCRNSDMNSGWVQGVLNAALLGRAKKASSDTLARALTPPAKGYRFPAFAPHEQDYEPSEDHLANMNTALQLMLLSSADDGLDNGGALLFPAWPCSWNVDFKLQAPRNTTVSGKLVGGKLLELSVFPPERRVELEVLPCQNV